MQFRLFDNKKAILIGPFVLGEEIRAIKSLRPVIKTKTVFLFFYFRKIIIVIFNLL